MFHDARLQCFQPSAEPESLLDGLGTDRAVMDIAILPSFRTI